MNNKIYKSPNYSGRKNWRGVEHHPIDEYLDWYDNDEEKRLELIKLYDMVEEKSDKEKLDELLEWFHIRGLEEGESHYN